MLPPPNSVPFSTRSYARARRLGRVGRAATPHRPGSRRRERMVNGRHRTGGSRRARTSESPPPTTNSSSSRGTRSRPSSELLTDAVERGRSDGRSGAATNTPRSPSSRSEAVGGAPRGRTWRPSLQSAAAPRFAARSGHPAPADFAIASSSSVCLRDMDAPPVTRMPLHATHRHRWPVSRTTGRDAAKTGVTSRILELA